MTRLSQVKQENKVQMLTAGMVFDRISSFELEEFEYGGKPVQSAKVTAYARGSNTEQEYHTTSTVIIKALENFFDKYQDDLENVKVVENKSKQNKGQTYLSLEPAD